MSPEGFAGLLERLASGRDTGSVGDGAVGDEEMDGSLEDVELLSYENALHGRGWTAASARVPGAAERGRRDGTEPKSAFRGAANEISAPGPKTVSITVRMSAGEALRLRTRAAEAGLSLSAYLRSCTVEADELRAQVKEALAELRAAAVRTPLANAGAVEEREAKEGPRTGWWPRLWPQPRQARG